ncbi:MAG: 7-cyano-7-deazaguanine synthase [Candidatus Odinarchaeota archaeon]
MQYWQKILDYNGKYYQRNMNQLKEFLVLNRGYVFEPPRGETVIIMFSGGMDSTSLIDLVVKHWDCRVILLHFKRNSRNQQWEEIAVDYFSEFYGEKYPENILELIKLEVEIPLRVNKQYLDQNRKKILGLPMRNATMWNHAITQAVYLSGKYQTTIRTILAGSVIDDLDNPESGPLSLLSQTISACICTAVWNWQIHSPMVDDSFQFGGISKADLVKYALDNSIPLERTRSCFDKTEEPCGECLACANRMKAFERE